MLPQISAFYANSTTLSATADTLDLFIYLHCLLYETAHVRTLRSVIKSPEQRPGIIDPKPNAKYPFDHDSSVVFRNA
jgi:hypothetical protein